MRLKLAEEAKEHERAAKALKKGAKAKDLPPPPPPAATAVIESVLSAFSSSLPPQGKKGGDSKPSKAKLKELAAQQQLQDMQVAMGRMHDRVRACWPTADASSHSDGDPDFYDPACGPAGRPNVTAAAHARGANVASPRVLGRSRSQPLSPMGPSKHTEVDLVKLSRSRSQPLSQIPGDADAAAHPTTFLSQSRSSVLSSASGRRKGLVIGERLLDWEPGLSAGLPPRPASEDPSRMRYGESH
jgi:hypothetical protein